MMITEHIETTLENKNHTIKNHGIVSINFLEATKELRGFKLKQISII